MCVLEIGVWGTLSATDLIGGVGRRLQANRYMYSSSGLANLSTCRFLTCLMYHGEAGPPEGGRGCLSPRARPARSPPCARGQTVRGRWERPKRASPALLGTAGTGARPPRTWSRPCPVFGNAHLSRERDGSRSHGTCKQRNKEHLPGCTGQHRAQGTLGRELSP